MIDIIICGEKSDSELDALIINNFKYTSNVTIHQSHTIPNLNSLNPIVIFKNSTKYPENFNVIPPKAICILNSENSSALNILSRQNIAAISCGMSSKNTLTISSINFPKVSISLQRQIYSISHKLIEPQEFIINIKKEYEPYSIIAASATILLLYSSIKPNAIL